MRTSRRSWTSSATCGERRHGDGRRDRSASIRPRASPARPARPLRMRARRDERYAPCFRALRGGRLKGHRPRDRRCGGSGSPSPYGLRWTDVAGADRAGSGRSFPGTRSRRVDCSRRTPWVLPVSSESTTKRAQQSFRRAPGDRRAAPRRGPRKEDTRWTCGLRRLLPSPLAELPGDAGAARDDRAGSETPATCTTRWPRAGWSAGPRTVTGEREQGRAPAAGGARPGGKDAKKAWWLESARSSTARLLSIYEGIGEPPASWASSDRAAQRR